MQPIPNFKDYFIDREGNIYSLRAGANQKKPEVPRKIKTYNSNGYRGIRLSKDGKLYKLFIHRILLEVFVSPCPPGYECRHINSIRDDNRLENLAWGSRVENMADKKLMGTENVGSKHGMSRLTEEQVKEIRRLGQEANIKERAMDKGGNYKEIGKIFGIAPSTVGAIVQERSWKHVK